jgi:hypothetical protein
MATIKKLVLLTYFSKRQMNLDMENPVFLYYDITQSDVDELLSEALLMYEETPSTTSDEMHGFHYLGPYGERLLKIFENLVEITSIP